MCGRFIINVKKEELIEAFDIYQSQLTVFEPSPNIPPGTHIPYIYQSDDKRQLSSALWGLIPSWSKDRSFASHTFNARSETVSDKPSFREAYKKRRCLIPATAYYEWANVRVNDKLAGKQPYWIGRDDEALFAFAGLYEHWTDTSSGESLESCTIITREAYPQLNHLHPRMPVILPSDSYDDWLNAKTPDFPMIAEDHLKFYSTESPDSSKNKNYAFDF